MSTGLLAVSPFLAGLLLAALLDHGVCKFYRHTPVHLFFAVFWAVFIFLLNQPSAATIPNMIAAIVQIGFGYLFLELLHHLDHTIFTYILVLFLGAFVLSFLYNLTYVIAGGQI